MAEEFYSASNVLLEIGKKFTEGRVIIVGDVMLDEYIWGSVNRISPEAPVPVVDLQYRTHAPGGAANVAVNVSSLGGTTYLTGIVGADAPYNQLVIELQQMGVDTDGLVVVDDRPTTTKTRIIAHSQHLVRFDSETRLPITSELEDRLLSWVAEKLNCADCCIVSDYAKGVITDRTANQIIKLSNKAGKPVIVDPKGSDFSKYFGANLITPNAHEAMVAAGFDFKHELDIEAAVEKLSATLDGSALLITQGKEGMSLFEDGKMSARISAVNHEVYDVTGAGDTVIGCIAISLAAGATLIQAATIANYAAGIVVGKVGTSLVGRDELLRLMQDLNCKV